MSAQKRTGEPMLFPRTAEVSSLYTLEFGCPSIARRFGVLDVERFPCLLKATFCSALRTLNDISTELITFVGEEE